MTPTDLRSAGEALYGSCWQGDLARAIGVTPRTVRRWLAGDRAMPGDLPARLRVIAIDRGFGLHRLIAELL